jgi:6-phosphogluconolactonase (cycloisomerase 2 family)
MRTVVPAFVALLAVVRAASAAPSILYATAATNGGVDAFCLRGGGVLAPTPKLHVKTAGPEPRRLLVGESASGQTLYVAELDRIEAFPIGGAGVLKQPSATKPGTGLDPRDLALAPDGRTLYATHHGYISAYELEADGSLPPQPTSCVQGAPGANYLDLQAANGLLYASADDAPGRIEVYRLGPDGSLPQTDCGPTIRKNGPQPPIFPDSERTRLQKPKGLVVAGDTIYVEERALRRLVAFRLQPDGTFCDRKRDRTGATDPPQKDVEDCTGFDQLAKSKKCAEVQDRIETDRQAGTSVVKHPIRHQQCAASKTETVLQYEGLVLHPNGQALIGAQFFKGRVDSYRLRPDARLPASPAVKLPRKPTALSTQDPRMTPVRLTVAGNTVYVATGELDRVVAYRLTAAGVLADKDPFSRTDEQKDSFPNDVAVAMLSAACE